MCSGGTITGILSSNRPTNSLAVVVTIVKVSNGVPSGCVQSSHSPASPNTGASFTRIWQGSFRPPHSGVSHSPNAGFGATVPEVAVTDAGTHTTSRGRADRRERDCRPAVELAQACVAVVTAGRSIRPLGGRATESARSDAIAQSSRRLLRNAWTLVAVRGVGGQKCPVLSSLSCGLSASALAARRAGRPTPARVDAVVSRAPFSRTHLVAEPRTVRRGTRT